MYIAPRSKSNISTANTFKLPKPLESRIFLFTLFFGFLFILVLPFSEIATSISNNGAYYLNDGWRIWNGNAFQFYRPGYVARGPLYSILIALILGISGQSIAATFFFSKLIHFLTLATFALFIRRYFSAMAASILFLLVLISPQLFKVGTQIDTQPLHALIMILFTWSWISFLDSLSAKPELAVRKFLLAGAIFSVGLYNKEMTLLFIAVIPLVLFIKNVSLLDRFRWFFGFFLLVTLLFSPWLIFVYKTSNSLWPALGHINPKFLAWFKLERLSYTEGPVLGSDISLLLSTILSIGKKLLFLTPLIILGFLILFKSSVQILFRKNTALQTCYAIPVIFLAATSQLITPYGALVVGSIEDVLRHAYLGYFFALIGIAPFITRHWNIQWKKQCNRQCQPQVTKKSLRMGSLLIVCTFIAGIGALWILSNSNHTYAKYLRSYSFFPRIYGRMTQDQKQAAKYILENIPKGTPLHTDGTLSEVFDFFLSYQYPTPQTLKIKRYRNGALPFPPACVDAPSNFSSIPEVRRLLDIHQAFWRIQLPQAGTYFIYETDEFCWPDVFSYWTKTGATQILFQNPDIILIKWLRSPTDLEIKKYQIIFSNNFFEEISEIPALVNTFKNVHLLKNGE